MVVRPIFGEVHPSVLHKFTHVTVNVRPLSLLWHNSSDVSQSVIVKWIANDVVNVTSVRHSCN